MKIIIELDNFSKSQIIDTARETKQKPEQILETLKNIYLANLIDDLDWIIDMSIEDELIGLKNE